MPGALRRSIKDWVGRRGDSMPNEFSWTFVISVDVTMLTIGAIAIFQRPMHDWPIAVAALVVAALPYLVFFIFNIVRFESFALGSSWMVGTAMLLFATSTPIPTDFAPLLLGLKAGVVASLASFRNGLLAAGASIGLLLAAAALHRLDSVALYVAFVGIGWLVGYLMHTQQELLLEQRRTQEQLSIHAAADERRRIAREIHDVIAHSLSVTLLHITGARRALQQDRDVDDAVDALQDAEHLGRQAMSDIRRTVGLLDGAPMRTAPEPGVGDIALMVDDFVKAGLPVRLRIDGPISRVSAAEGLALFRITQESLTNIAKYAQDSEPVVLLRITRGSAELSVVNRLPQTPAAHRSQSGRGIAGMRQRVELLGGTIDIGPTDDQWAVRASIPLTDSGLPRPPWCPA